MAKTTLIHPIPLPTIRGYFVQQRINVSRVTQVRYTPEDLHAEYDVMIESIEWQKYGPEDWTPKEVRFAVEGALQGCSSCDYIVWRRDHWIAHISTWIPYEKTPLEAYIENPPEGSEAWIRAQEGID